MEEKYLTLEQLNAISRNGRSSNNLYDYGISLKPKKHPTGKKIFSLNKLDQYSTGLITKEDYINSEEKEKTKQVINAINFTLKNHELLFERYLKLRLNFIKKEILKLQLADRYLGIEETRALFMLEGRQRELNSIYGKIKEGKIFQSVCKLESSQA